MHQHSYSIDDQINDLSLEGRPHLVILGAGASRQAFPNGDKNGMKIPLMNDLVEVCELAPLLDKHEIIWQGKNFETLYAQIHKEHNEANLLKEIEIKIRQYFSLLELPDVPTMYDYLVLSLRKKDRVATFNWDPFLFEALKRNKERASDQLPKAYFLHGNVALGFCSECKQFGEIMAFCSKCKEPYLDTPLLYPIESKDYLNDPFISSMWQSLTSSLKSSLMLTIFGYSAPESDKEAIQFFKSGWGNRDDRQYEETEFIDIKDEDEIIKTWEKIFIYSHHYSTKNDFYESKIAKFPRRSVESFWAEKFNMKILDPNPIKIATDFEQLERFITPIIKIEMLSKA